ncbi:HAD family hydrolase [Nocardia abscessus]|uniref:HAD family hydrolase n=1 Tax=Nocardia abscessus TaxID=120957 RepID=UPI003CC7F9A7
MYRSSKARTWPQWSTTGWPQRPSRTSSRPSRVAYIGDRLHTDAEAATRAGMRGIWLDRGRIGAVTSVPRLTTLTELQPLLTGPIRHSDSSDI